MKVSPSPGRTYLENPNTKFAPSLISRLNDDPSVSHKVPIVRCHSMCVIAGEFMTTPHAQLQRKNRPQVLNRERMTRTEKIDKRGMCEALIATHNDSHA